MGISTILQMIHSKEEKDEKKKHTHTNQCRCSMSSVWALRFVSQRTKDFWLFSLSDFLSHFVGILHMLVCCLNCKQKHLPWLSHTLAIVFWLNFWNNTSKMLLGSDLFALLLHYSVCIHFLWRVAFFLSSLCCALPCCQRSMITQPRLQRMHRGECIEGESKKESWQSNGPNTDSDMWHQERARSEQKKNNNSKKK